MMKTVQHFGRASLGMVFTAMVKNWLRELSTYSPFTSQFLSLDNFIFSHLRGDVFTEVHCFSVPTCAGQVPPHMCFHQILGYSAPFVIHPAKEELASAVTTFGGLLEEPKSFVKILRHPASFKIEKSKLRRCLTIPPSRRFVVPHCRLCQITGYVFLS
jgi:hypothetical protein